MRSYQLCGSNLRKRLGPLSISHWKEIAMTAKPPNASARGDNASGPPQGSNDDYTLHDHLMKRLALPFVRDEVNKIAALYDAASADTSEAVGRRFARFLQAAAAVASLEWIREKDQPPVSCTADAVTQEAGGNTGEVDGETHGDHQA
jgi:hypothetical protein